MLDLVEILFSRYGIQNLRYDGKMDRAARDTTLATFKKSGGPKVILIRLVYLTSPVLRDLRLSSQYQMRGSWLESRFRQSDYKVGVQISRQLDFVFQIWAKR
jgi:hypothetical protein